MIASEEERSEDKPSLLVLDLDETLIHACDDRARQKNLECSGCVPDFYAAGMPVFVRPYAKSFLARVSKVFDKIAIWTSAGSGYTSEVLPHLFPPDGVKLQFVWTAERVTRRYDPFLYTHYDVKDLRKVKRQGYALERILIVDDTKRKAERNYGNLVHVDAFEGDSGDTELLLLAEYLESLAPCRNYRCIEKRHWRSLVSEGAMPASWSSMITP
mmetsp:Transcript_15120/g.29835  ORF Transcript_15120/g.29835 Transcript_15120/m.29835 type:complete len:214 (-) Transcript_15120:61-702(-)|eukprot:CAMPEP_0173399380 /NCGR_PEP_ID=MMETSP1356-20130122/44778_1 /TAXON_ID=77927 ORGANISM="Hemiselmis virescens, Strain PCC157" /NCGR_SAMPLE_ID=MMETSP1356 /ASSEMBLY_ACC=CAM_ASM_000847 /LENGTH=213 /DNA_ID=CAMNT_0014359087 /DNA_START=73 /DNA_END=714 /DNA_ORIENTATION=-